MNNKNKRLFELAEIEIVSLNGCDIIVTSNQNPFEGEEDEFDYPHVLFGE